MITKSSQWLYQYVMLYIDSIRSDKTDFKTKGIIRDGGKKISIYNIRRCSSLRYKNAEFACPDEN